MASGNSSDPPDRHRHRAREGRRPSLRLNSEDQVAQETEEVFRSYAFYRYQQEREESGGEVPMDPEIAEIQQEPGSTSNQVGRRLAIIGDDINMRYDAEFQNMLKTLQPTKDNAYEYFTKIASSLFDSGINWGRVIALLGFGYRMAIHVYQHGVTGFLRSIARYVAEFVLRNRIAQWIADQGGWVAALELDNVYVLYMMGVLVVVLLGHLVVRRFFSP
ncbi:bcl-2 homologous antagonist/killer [Chrysemys picta bellii]|uniref:Bcl-2 homologous antagonist/killer n=1 Tax=Chrysemys picta bellii TaxID=8478 RepID=A0A8C3IM95_CHRPI|nr:bcl-2 homologous antagonist/killer isoform X1 [Chrysemys picta bellii]